MFRPTNDSQDQKSCSYLSLPDDSNGDLLSDFATASNVGGRELNRVTVNIKCLMVEESGAVIDYSFPKF
jgi:hypothetical protein